MLTLQQDKQQSVQNYLEEDLAALKMVRSTLLQTVARLQERRSVIANVFCLFVAANLVPGDARWRRSKPAGRREI